MAENKGRKNRENLNETETDSTKTELANQIAHSTQKMATTYQHIEDTFLRGVRWFSSAIDHTLFNSKYTKVIALVLAIFMYFSVNYDESTAIYTTPLKSSRDMTAQKVTAQYNSDTFELSGLPETASITITGDATSVTNAVNSGGNIVADLEGLTEGTHEVKLSAEGFGNNVDVKIEPSNTYITLKKKTTQQFDLSYDFINTDKMDAIYSVGTPVFEYTKVNVRASKDTLSTISFVKALIDVSGQTTDFTEEAKLVAYDSSGQPVSADIVPNTVEVSVPVTSPNKTVPIEVEVSGEVPDGKAISSISMDQQSVTIYGTESVLGQIEKVTVTLNATSLTKDQSTVLRPITLPSGVNSSNINQINMTVMLEESVTKTIDNVTISYRNNTNNYKASQPDNKTTTSVTVVGAADNVEKVTADSINVYVDMKDAVPGIQEFPLQVDQPANGLVKYNLKESTYTLNVLGETTTGTESGSEAEVNNG